jgi:hypothetical protein
MKFAKENFKYRLKRKKGIRESLSDLTLSGVI